MGEMTNEELDRLDAIEKAATVGPWDQAHHIEEQRAIVARALPCVSLLGLDVDGMAIVGEEVDAALIVEARNALRPLIEEVRKLRQQNEALERGRQQSKLIEGLPVPAAHWEKVHAEGNAGAIADVRAYLREEQARLAGTSVSNVTLAVFDVLSDALERGDHVGAASRKELR
ncbi:MAG: hypothetical protein HOW73_20455 [Polyangiaceae bacterium]|nr:hypothetical protein [Polyangiaceae bacterium]